MQDPASSRRIFRVEGMDCADEVAALRSVLAPLDGIERLDFDILAQKLTVTGDPERIGGEAIPRAVSTLGLRAEPWREDVRQPPGVPFDRRAVATIASGLLLLAGLIAAGIAAGGWPPGLGGRRAPAGTGPAVFLYLAAILAGGWTVLPRAWAAARRLRPDMHLLMTVAVAGAVGIGEWFEGGAVAFLFSLSLLLESWSVARARRAVAALLSLAPPEATVLHDPGGAGDGTGPGPADPPDRPQEHRVKASEVAPGARILVRPGEKVPLDGTILRGETHIDQSPITGESLPAPRGPGAEVFAGTINQEGAIEVRTTRPAGDTTLARIIRLVGQAQARRSPSERFVDRFARVYTPAVMALAVVTGVVPPLLAGADWSLWLYRSLVLLVIACPCALVISTPVSIVSALAAAARRGVLVKGGRHVEAPARLRCIALDKTGTLTEGRPVVRDVVPLDGHTERELLEIAAAMEARSEHPLARALADRAGERGITPVPASDFTIIRGKGAEGRIGGRPFWIGSHRLLEERGQETPELHDRLEALAADGASVVVIGNDEHVCGLITIADRIRPEAGAAVAALHRLGVERVALLTGDNLPTARAVAAAIGIDDVRAELLPEDKVRAVDELVSRHGRVAMVGDGVNDAPAMARADLGIAMGAAGTDAAIETADVVILSDDLSRLPWLVRHSRWTGAVVRQNILAALGIKVVFFVLAYGGWATLWGAIAADMGVSLGVIANGLRLLQAGSLSRRRESRRPGTRHVPAGPGARDPAGRGAGRAIGRGRGGTGADR